MKKNTAGQAIGAQMVTAADGTAFTAAVTVYVTGDAGVQAVGSVGAGACVHEGNGYHTYAPAQAETNYDLVGFTFIGTGAIPSSVQVYTSFPQTGDAFVRVGAPAGASVSADVAAIKTETATILGDTNDIQTRLPAALVAGRMDSSTGAMAAAVVTAAAIATDAIDNDAIAADVTAVIADAVWNGATASYGTAGTYGALVETNLDAAVTSRMATYAQPAGFLAATFPAGTVANTTNITAATGVVLSGVTHTGAVIPTVSAVSGAVGSVTARVTANTDQINGVATAAARLALSTQGIVTGTVGAGSSTTSIVTSALDPAAAVIDQYKGRIVTFKQDTATANLRGQSTDITASTALGVLTVTALTTAPASGDTFTIT